MGEDALHRTDASKMKASDLNRGPRDQTPRRTHLIVVEQLHRVRVVTQLGVVFLRNEQLSLGTARKCI